MTAPVRAFPDVEYVVTTWIRDHLNIRCVTELPAQMEDAVPLAWVERIGGQAIVPGILDRARIDVDTFASTLEKAIDLALTIQTWMPALHGRIVPGGVVCRVEEEVGPSRRPEWNSRVRRRGATYILTLRPD